MKARFYQYVCLLTAIVFMPATVFAESSSWVQADHVKARLIAADSDAGAFDIALELDLEDGWHTYWRTPGEAGLAPRWNWDGSANVAEIKALYPAPTRKDEAGFQTFGYVSDTVFPIELTQEDDGKTVYITLALNVMVCKDTCIPQNMSLSWDVPKTAGDEFRTFIDQAYASVPHQGDTPDLKIESAVAGEKGVVLNVYSKNGFEAFDAFIEGADPIIVSIPQIDVHPNDPMRAFVKIPPPEDAGDFMESISGKAVSATITNGDASIEKPLNF
jgi:suppressor for copper-sensitivity B